MKRFIVFLFLLALGSGLLSGLDRIVLETTYVDGDEEFVRELDRILARSSVLANKLYSGYFTLDTKPKTVQGYSIKVVAVSEGEETTVSMTMTAPGSEEEISSAVLGHLTEERVSHFANLYFYMWSSFHGYLLDQIQQPPVLIEEFSTDAIAERVNTGMPMQLFPYAAAVKQNGNVLIAFISQCVELENTFKIVGQPGKELLEKGNYTYAYGVAATPGGTVYLKPSAGREVYKIIEGAPRPIRIKTGMEVQGPFVLLPDGSFVLIDMVKKKAMRIDGKKRQELDLFSGPYSYISAAAAGPEGNIWVFDGMERRVLIYSPEGQLLDSVIPVVPQDIPLSPFSMDVYPDGSFVLFSSGELWKFRKNGEAAWRLSELQGESLSQTMSVALDKRKGIVYLTDVMGRRILKLLDAGFAQKQGIRDPFDEAVIALTGKISKDPDNASLYEEKARLYVRKGAFELAKVQWEQILEIDPFDDQAQDEIDRIDLVILTDKAGELKTRTLDLIESLGPESARGTYRQALQVYERIFSLGTDDPRIDDVRKDYENLKRDFLERSTGQEDKKGLKLVKVEIDNMFPSLIHYYQDNPVGTVLVQNILDRDIRNVVASVAIRKYVDFPTESKEIQVLKAGSKAEIPLYLTLNEEVFSLQEDLPVQLRIEVQGRSGGTEVTESESTTATLFRRTALTWESTAKLASFIMPNEAIVSGFSHRVLTSQLEDSGSPYTGRMERAIRICDALGSYDITYVEDPDSPISEILGRKAIVDTVRFPRTTLYIRSGDCDDTTALLTSLLESAGIRTAILTTPGHVFCAFDSGEPEGNRWMFSAKNIELIPFDGSLWIPVETTVLQEGFSTAWREASRLVQKYQPSGDVEFLPVHTLREKHPPLPIGESSFIVAEPPTAEIDRLFQYSLTTLSETLYSEGLAALERDLKGMGSRARLKQQNRIGILHARFGDVREAEDVFRSLIKNHPDFLSPYINLANLELKLEDIPRAIEVLEMGLEIKPSSPHINLLLARSYHALADQKQAERYFAIVKKSAPDIAMRYSYLESGDGGTGRASAAGSDLEEFLWAVEE